MLCEIRKKIYGRQRKVNKICFENPILQSDKSSTEDAKRISWAQSNILTKGPKKSMFHSQKKKGIIKNKQILNTSKQTFTDVPTYLFTRFLPIPIIQTESI